MNATQTTILNAVKAGRTIRVSNRNDVDAGKAHHATVKVLVAGGFVVVKADKSLALTASEANGASKAERKGNPARPSGKLEALREALAFAMEREATCRKMMNNGTVNRVRWEQWARKVEVLRAELARAA